MCAKLKFLLMSLLMMPLASYAVPKIEHWTLSNGVRVYFVEAREIPMLQVRLVFDAGAARDPKDKAGLALLTSAMMNEGAGSLTTDDIAAQFENLGAQFGTGVERDMATVSLRTLTESELMEPALALFSKILSGPTFPKQNLERERARMLIGLAREAQSPGAMAHRTFMRELYRDHAYAIEPAGEEASLTRISRDDLVAYHSRYYVGRNAWLAMIGNLSLSEARRVSEKLTASLRSGEVAPPLIPAV